MVDRTAYYASYYRTHHVKVRQRQKIYQRAELIVKAITGEPTPQNRRAVEYRRRERDTIKIARALGVPMAAARALLNKKVNQS